MDTSKQKRIGTREEVFKGLAVYTAGGLKKDDIIEKKIGSRVLYISKKLSEKMKENINVIRTNNPNFFKRLQKKTHVAPPSQPNVVGTNQYMAVSAISRKKNMSKTQKLAFKVKENEVRTVFYPELKGMDLKELKEELLREEAEEDLGMPKQSIFKIEELPDIDINGLDQTKLNKITSINHLVYLEP